MKTRSFILLIFFLVLFLYGCTKEQPVVQEAPAVQTPPVAEVKLTPSCNDNNVCTEDIFNELTQECEHRKLERCCGDGFCDMNERCDHTIHSTICSDDCPRECPAFVEYGDWICSGNCLKTQDYYTVDGDAAIKTTLENIGELGLGNLESSFYCELEGNGRFYTAGDVTVRNGVKVIDYFDQEDEVTFLTGRPYLNNKVNYTLEFIGHPEKDFSISCTVRFSANEFYYSKDIKVKFVNIQ